MQLRDYQERFLVDLRAAFRAGARRVLGVSPTGSGKTACAAAMTFGATALGHRTLFAAGRRELIDQTVRTLARSADISIASDMPLTDVVEALAAAGRPVRVIRAQHDLGPQDAPVIVGSVQTLSAPRWLGALPAVQFGILDEAHHGSAATWADLVRSQPEARWVGLTATPERADGKPLGDLFDALVAGPSVRELTPRVLVPCRIWAGPATLKPGELAMTPLEAYQRFAALQRAGVFCRDVAHARAELEVFRAAGIPADIVTGDMADVRRRDILAAWRAGDILVVTSVGVLTEGFDLPELGVAILARRFNHPGQYLQVAGRILRIAPGKTSATLVDLTGCAHEHGPVELDREYSLTGTAISGRRAADSFGQCRECGSMFLYGPRTCPHCGAAIPTRPREAPRSVNTGVAELGPAKPRTPWVSRLDAKRDGYCRKCGRWFPRGTPIFYTQGQPNSARHQTCPAPALPSAGVSP